MKKDKEKEPEKADKVASSAVPKKKGFEEERKDSDDSSDDEQVSPSAQVCQRATWAGASILPDEPYLASTGLLGVNGARTG